MTETRWPSVTAVLKAAGLVDFSGIPEDVLEKARRRGVDTHSWAELYDQGHWKLGEEGPDEDVTGYVTAYAKFRAETGFAPSLIEEYRRHDLHRYTGKLDRFGAMGGTPWLLDLKCAAQIRPEVALQLAGYALLLGTDTVKRGAVQLKRDGTYRLHTFESKEDYPDFLAAVRIAWLRLRWEAEAK